MRLCAPLNPGSLVRVDNPDTGKLNRSVAQLALLGSHNLNKLRRMNDLWSDLYGTPELDRRRLRFMT